MRRRCGSVIWWEAPGIIAGLINVINLCTMCSDLLFHSTPGVPSLAHADTPVPVVMTTSLLSIIIKYVTFHIYSY